MQLQMTTDYAIRIMLYLADKKGVVSSTELSDQLAIPQKYVPRVGNKLKAANLVGTVTGSLGGYFIERPLEDISLYEIITAFEGSIKLNRCLEVDGYCSRQATHSCVVHSFFRGVQETLEEKFKAETLATLLKNS